MERVYGFKFLLQQSVRLISSIFFNQCHGVQLALQGHL